MKFIAYHLKDPLVFGAKTGNGVILSRFECGIGIEPNPHETECFIELENEKAIIFPKEEDTFKALILKISK